ncbi:hypothetical protein H6M51_11135 [Rhizobium sp. AQ_MP]|uniref:hypothetical protein n=1 Tax=Rhizobium sp. AQ_MP TaxID=2761536 RepID=UPI00163ADAE0|nr:hypothetical protein [Rhizobium sp. AQ_MP]MBC2773421.1 hypothetical protein [Rhizobium sp. AQ_MP]
MRKDPNNGQRSRTYEIHVRTTAQHRAAVAAWREHAPANDSDIFTTSRSSSPRHAGLSDDLAVILKWRAISRPPAEPLRTNWSIIPANDNFEEEERDDEPAPPIVECEHEIRPTVGALMAAVKNVELEPHRPGLIDRRPVGGDIEKRGGQIVRLGALRFGIMPTVADGTTTRPGNNRQIISWRGKRPVDRFGRAKGADLDEEEEFAKRQRLANWLGCYAGEFIPQTAESRRKARERANRVKDRPLPALPPTTMPLNEARAFAGLPPVEQDPRPVLPTGSLDVGDIFSSWVAMPKKANQGATIRDDEHTFDRAEVVSKLPAQDVTVLDAALTARNMTDIGNVVGFAGKVAERKGRQALQEACERLSKILSAA